MEEILQLKKRFSRKDKTNFLNQLKIILDNLGYSTETKSFRSFIKSVNLETTTKKTDYLFLAHYDTGTKMPFWMKLIMQFFGINRQLIMILLVIVFSILFFILKENIIKIYPFLVEYKIILKLTFFIILLSLFLPMLFPNTHNFDDNTSGVIALIYLAKKFKENGIENAKFVFVDNEELGLFGSNAHKKYLKKNNLLSNDCKIISIDCVGGKGEFPIIIRNSKSDYENIFKTAIEKEFGLCKSIKMLLPASDNYSFKKYGAINISFADNSLISNGYWIKNIHSSNDNEINLNRIEKLCETITKIVYDENKINK